MCIIFFFLFLNWFSSNFDSTIFWTWLFKKKTRLNLRLPHKWRCPLRSNHWILVKFALIILWNQELEIVLVLSIFPSVWLLEFRVCAISQQLLTRFHWNFVGIFKTERRDTHTIFMSGLDNSTLELCPLISNTLCLQRKLCFCAISQDFNETLQSILIGDDFCGYHLHVRVKSFNSEL